MKKAIRLIAMLLCFLLLAGCDQDPEQPTASGNVWPTLATKPAEKPTEKPVEDPKEPSLKALRGKMYGGHVLGVAYFGYHDTVDSDEPVDPYAVMEEHASQLSDAYPFLLNIPETQVVGGDHGDLFCIVPKAPNYSVRISRATWKNDDCVYDDVIYESDTGEPVLLFCNNAGIEPDTQVRIVGPDDAELVWYPMRDNNQCVLQLWDEDGEQQIFDFSPYWELMLSEYIKTCSMGWLPADEEALLGSWWGLDIRVDGSDFFYDVTFYADYTADITWYDGEDHEYLGAEWRIYEKNEFPVLAIDLGGLAGVREYNVLWEEDTQTLYFIRDISEHTLQPGMEPLERFLHRSESAAPAPEDMVGSWDLAWTEVEGYVTEYDPGAGAIEIWQDDEGTFRISYTNRDFPRNNFKNKTLAVFGGEMYAGCGNDQWVADVGFIGPDDTFFAVTLLEDGTLLMQTYWEMEGQMWVSYAWFTRA